MRVLLSVISFRYLTGAELYVYELARELVRRGHEVTIVSQVGGVLTQRAKDSGIQVFDYSRLPAGAEFDVLHVQEHGPAKWAMQRFPSTPVIATVHSQWPCENPLIDARIHKYVCIRPEVRDKVVAVDGTPAEKTRVVYNGVDVSRFAQAPHVQRERPLVLFAGTVDPLRRAAALDLIARSQREDFDVRFIGKRHSDHLDGPLPDNVEWIPGDVWDIERHVQECTATAGIVLGRTTIEGWACGKPGWIYDVDLGGRIRSVELHPPPHKDILAQFDIGYMTREFESLYLEAVEAVDASPARRRGGVSTEPDPAKLARLDAIRPRPADFLVDRANRNVLAFAEEACRDPELLAGWAADHHGDQTATLVLYAKGSDEATWVARLQEALDAAGVSLEHLDVLLFVAGPGDSLNGVASDLDGVLTRQERLPHALVGLPRVAPGETADSLDLAA